MPAKGAAPRITGVDPLGHPRSGYTEAGRMSKDVIMDLVNQASEAAIRKHGGIDSYFKYLQKLDCARQKGKQRIRQKRRAPLARNA